MKTFEFCCKRNLRKSRTRLLFMDTHKTCEFTAAVHGFHVYMRHCQPVENDELVCYHDAENSYDIFAVKICQQGNDANSGHLSMEISRIARKYILQRGAQVKAKLIATHCRISPLVALIFLVRSKLPCQGLCETICCWKYIP